MGESRLSDLSPGLSMKSKTRTPAEKTQLQKSRGCCIDAGMRSFGGRGGGGVQGGLPGDQKGVRHPGLSPQQGVLIQLPKGAIPVRKVLWSTSAQTKLIVYHEKAAVITGFEIHQNNPLRSYR